MNDNSSVMLNARWPVTAQVHRFGDCVAIYVGSGETVYLPRRHALALARAIRACAVDIAKNPSFTQSKFGTFNLSMKEPE